jgi:ribosomal protein S18 acetylase RimI-like enzyme
MGCNGCQCVEEDIVLIRAVRDSDWEPCLGIDLAYETDTAWQMDEIQDAGEWHVSFREIRLPRTLRIQPPSPDDNALKSWQSRDSFWVAVEQRGVVGYLGIDIDAARHQAQIVDLAVAPQFRRQGVASALLERALEGCLRQRVQQVVLICPLRAYPALNFALKHRFAFCGFQDAYWPGQEVALFFRQRIR